MVEALKQGQYVPLPVEKQVLLAFAVTNGFADDVEPDNITVFEDKLYEYFDANHKDLMTSLQTDYSDEIIENLKSSLEKFKGVYSS